MPGLMAADVHRSAVGVVRTADAACQGVFPAWNGDQVNKVRHEAIAHQVDVVLLAVFGEQIQVQLTIKIGEESGGEMIPALGNMMEHANGDPTSKARHSIGYGERIA